MVICLLISGSYPISITRQSSDKKKTSSEGKDRTKLRRSGFDISGTVKSEVTGNINNKNIESFCDLSPYAGIGIPISDREINARIIIGAAKELRRCSVVDSALPVESWSDSRYW